MKTTNLCKTLLLGVGLVGVGLTWAQGAQDAPLRTHTSDGRAFESLTEAESDALPDKEFDAFAKWQHKKQQDELKELEEKVAQSGLIKTS